MYSWNFQHAVDIRSLSTFTNNGLTVDLVSPRSYQTPRLPSSALNSVCCFKRRSFRSELSCRCPAKLVSTLRSTLKSRRTTGITIPIISSGGVYTFVMFVVYLVIKVTVKLSDVNLSCHYLNTNRLWSPFIMSVCLCVSFAILEPDSQTLS